MFRKRNEAETITPALTPSDRVTSVIGPGIAWQGSLSGSGGLRIEGAFEGDINLRGLLVVGETGRVTGQSLKANTIVVAGAVRANLTAEKVEIRSTGRVWGNVLTTSFATEEGAFLRGQIQMEEKLELNPPEAAAAPISAPPAAPTDSAAAEDLPAGALPAE